MPWNDNLEGTALEIASSTSNRLRVMAGPGTGKSFAMKRRIMRLIEEEGVQPSKILAVTFTRTAANDLKTELHDLGIEGAEEIKAMTLHAFCFALLNKRDVFERLARQPRPLKSFTSKGSPQFELSPLLADLDQVGTFGNKREKFKLIKAFEAAWAKNQDETLWATEAMERDFKDSLLTWLKAHDSMLIGELIPLSLKYLEDNPASDVFDQFSHIVVDEYQDLNKAEQILLDLLGRDHAIGIVGDEDQSIYSFRYAHPTGIADFSNRHTTVDDYDLIECRRCDKKIVSVADSLISNNHPAGAQSRLSPLATKDNGNMVSVQWRDSDEEAAGVADFVKHLIDNTEYAPKDILILSPRRLLGYKLRDLIDAKGVPVHSFFHEEAVEDDEAQKAVTLLNLIAKPTDKVALRYWLGYGSTSWRAPQYKKLMQKSHEEGRSVRDILDSIVAGNLNMTGITHIVAAYKTLNEAIEPLNERPLNEVIDAIFPIENDATKVLREAALLFHDNNDGASVEDLWSQIETLLTQPEMPEAGDFVRIMSLHKSKGLTSKVTIVSSCIQGLIPNTDDELTPDEQAAMLKEQRRLFYVALTRAKNLLVLSSFLECPHKYST